MQNISGVVGGIIGVFLLFIFPVWSLIHCAVSKELGTKTKVGWLLVILVTWTLGGVFYGIFSARSLTLKIVSWVVIVLGVVLIVGGILLYGQSLRLPNSQSSERTANHSLQPTSPGESEGGGQEAASR